MRTKISIIICLFIIVYGIVAAQNNKIISSQKKIIIGMIGKIGSNPVFIAAHTGARVAAKEIGAKYKVSVEINWQTPEMEDVQAQANAIKQLSRSRVDGIAIACTDAKYLTPIINEAVDGGTPIMCFDSDAPESKRFAYYGANDNEFGREIMKQLAVELKGKGTIAVLAGNKLALNQQLRLKGIKEELKKYPNISLPADNIYHNIEVPNLSVELVSQEQKKKRNITGWAFQGSWPLLVKEGLPWNPGELIIVAGHAVPAELEHIKNGHVQSLVGINCFQYGYRSIEILLDKIINNNLPKEPRMYIELTPVSKDNVEEWSLNWKKWLIKEAVYR